MKTVPAIEITTTSFQELKQQHVTARRTGATCITFQGVEIEMEFVGRLIEAYAPRVARWEQRC